MFCIIHVYTTDQTIMKIQCMKGLTIALSVQMAVALEGPKSEQQALRSGSILYILILFIVLFIDKFLETFFSR